MDKPRPALVIYKTVTRPSFTRDFTERIFNHQRFIDDLTAAI